MKTGYHILGESDLLATCWKKREATSKCALKSMYFVSHITAGLKSDVPPLGECYLKYMNLIQQYCSLQDGQGPGDVVPQSEPEPEELVQTDQESEQLFSRPADITLVKAVENTEMEIDQSTVSDLKSSWVSSD